MTAESWISVGRQAACALGLAAAAAGWGELALRALRIPRPERPPWRLALGLLTLSFLSSIAALGGLLRPLPIALVTAVGLVGLARTRLALPSPGAWHFCTWHFSLATMLGLLFVLSLYPPSSFDETTYHLPMAASLAEHGAARWLDHLRWPVFPQTTEALAAVLTIVGGREAAHLVQLLAFGALIVLLAGDRSPRAGRLAGAFLLGSPLLISQASALYVDLFLTLAVTVAVLGAERFREARQSGWWVLSATAGGLAPTIKYLGGVGALVAGVLVGTAPGGRQPTRWSVIAAYCGVAGLVLAPTFLWLWATTGNPVFPFAGSLFGEGAWSPHQVSGAASERLARFALLPWNVFADRTLAGSQPPPSPWLWLVVVVALGSLRANPVAGARRMLLTVSAYLALSLALFVGLGDGTELDVRFLIPAAPLLALAAARAVEPRRGSRSVAIAILALALPGLAYGAFQLWRLGAVPLTAPARSEFLARHHEGFRAVREAERHSRIIFVVGNERLIGLGRGVIYGDVTGRLPAGEAVALLRTPDHLARRLDGIGIDALIVLRRAWPSQLDPGALSRSGRFDLSYQDDEALVWRVLSPVPPVPRVPRVPDPDR